MPTPSSNEVVLSLISHTNVGKTALARTLLRRDVGEVADRAHVTVVSEAYPLLEFEGGTVKLWDTPGFGANLAKLAKRLRTSKNPVGWILHQVWDRVADQSLWCSQEAIRNIQADADVVLYLVDATQSPGAVGYVDLEMEILSWIGKPVLVYLNQVGKPDREQIGRFEEEWRQHFAGHGIVAHVGTLDAFTRCWVEEHRLFEKVAEVLGNEGRDEGKSATARRAAAAWKEKNLAIFEEAVAILAEWAAESLCDTEKLPDRSLLDKGRSLVKNLVTGKGKGKDPELEAVQKRMLDRLSRRTREAVNRIIAAHGIDGETARKWEESSRDDFALPKRVEESFATALGAAASGLGGGLAADLAVGGMTFGGGAILGLILGGGGAYALARGYNFALTGDNSARWTEAQFREHLRYLALIYLAVAHFGRARGPWRDPGNNPGQWESHLEDRIKARAAEWTALWKKGGASGDPAKLREKLVPEIRDLIAGELAALYPEEADLLEKR